MKIDIVKSLFVLSLISLIACSPIELYQAENTYEEAKLSKNGKRILASLTLLATLDSSQYKNKLDEAKLASLELQKAKSFLAEDHIYLAYLSSHDSYRTMATTESKDVLLKVGGQLRYLLDVQSNIAKSFDNLPTPLSTVILKYQNQSVLKWDVIKINSVMEQLGQAAKFISHSLSILEREKGAGLSPEITQWQLAIESQLKMINQVEQYLINLALSSSAIELEKLNAELTNNSENLLSLVREELAQETMQPHFIKANKEYQRYFNLNENLSLASSPTRRNSHASWYKDWNAIEKEVLESISPFSSYPTTSLNRVNKLKSFINGANKMKPDLELGSSSLYLFMSKFGSIYNLLEKLNKDRMLLTYG
ncbi:hypothetical protein [Colwellia sp. 12G3]|uniref:hypothetical protein n=1 Tax=Colwellia sp. 12G3 TaxID=2058299 RepID=UPI000C32D876|nr:hypothetical protein [Colwellia sp. 12G3]PKI17765.1 hypothetical protein CXF71_01785 [Colwellia sp. 12G3]